jgi:hypothetical protein
MQEGYKQNFFYHRIPEASEIGDAGSRGVAKPAWLFGILDSSGSMSSHWKFVADHYNALMDEVDQSKVITLCFDTKVREEPNKKITDKIHNYGGGCTNILLAFQEFEKRIETIPADEEIKVIFLSDGEDTVNSNLQEKLKTLKGGQNKKITFMCLGVQSGFPTFISMHLRELYHRGDASCPSIFLIEYSSDKAFFNKFQSIRPFIKTKEEIKVDPEQFLFPWEAVSPSIPEGRWIMSEDKKIVLNGGAATIEYDDKLFSIEAVIDIFRSWTQKLQLDSINKKITPEKTKEYAESTYNLMMDIIEDIKHSKGLRLLSTDQDDSGENFNAKVLNLQIKRTGSRITGYLSSMKELKDGLNLQNLSEFEAAKIIGLGTIVGKHQQRALAMKNITKEKYRQMVQEFVAVLNSTPFDNATDVPEAYQTKMTPIKLFKDASLKEGLEKIESPLVFLELYPLQGIPVKLKRNEGCETDPWKVEVKEYSLLTKSADATAFDLATHRAMLPESNVEIEYHGYVPLFGPRDQQLAPIFNTELVKYALSYNATFEIDNVLEESYLSLLSGVFELAYKRNDDFAKEILDKVYYSLKLISGQAYFKRLVEGFKNGDAAVIAGITSVRLFYLLVFYLSREIKDKEECEEYVQKLWIAYFSSKLVTRKITDFVSTEQENNLKEELKKKYTPEYIMKTFYTGHSIKEHLKKNLEKEIKENSSIGGNSNVQVNKSVYSWDVNDVQSFDVTQRLSKETAGVEVKDDDILVYLAHCVKHSTAQERYANLLSNDKAAASQALAKEFLTKDDTSKKLVKRINYQLLDELATIYYKEFKKLHWNTLPLKKDEIEKECKDRNIDIATLGYSQDTGLCSKACVSKTCPWFLYVRNKDRSLRNHLGGWQNFLPAGFHLFVRANPGKTVNEIFDEFIVKQNNVQKMDAAGVTEEECKKYIADVKTHYA